MAERGHYGPDDLTVHVAGADGLCDGCRAVGLQATYPCALREMMVWIETHPMPQRHSPDPVVPGDPPASILPRAKASTGGYRWGQWWISPMP